MEGQGGALSQSDQPIGDADVGGLRMTDEAIADAEKALANLLGPDRGGDNTLRRLNLAAFLGERYAAPLLTDWQRMKTTLEQVSALCQMEGGELAHRIYHEIGETLNG